jgi:hypothetical protein
MLSAIIRAITITIILVTLSSCAGTEKRTDTPEEVLNKAMGANAVPPGRISMLPGADRSDLPYVPVITPPEIARIWIYDHVTPSNDLVVGHWIFIKLRDEKWYIEEQWNDKTTKVKKRPPLPPSEHAVQNHMHHATPAQSDKPPGKTAVQTQGLTPMPPAGR